jgi:hypothetical protein
MPALKKSGEKRPAKSSVKPNKPGFPSQNGYPHSPNGHDPELINSLQDDREC